MITTDVEIDLRKIREDGRVVAMTRDEARQLIDADIDEDLATVLDYAQGDQPNNGTQYVILKIG